MSTREVFDRLYERYDEWYERNRVTAENEARLVESIVRDAPRPVLEVGVGTGYFASRVGAEAGLDPSPGMLSIAARRGLEHLVVGIGERLPFRESSFGTVLLVVTLCFVDRPVDVLRESRRVLRPGGVVIACIVPRDSLWGRYYTRLASEGHPFYSVARFYTVKEVYIMLEVSSLEIEDTWGVLGYGPLDRPREEEPSRDIEDKGFVCIKARRR